MKICARCAELKPVTIFLATPGRGDGFRSRCNPCRQETRPQARESAQRMVRYHANGDASRRAQKAYQEANRDKYREACRKWRALNPEKQAAAAARWNAENSDRNAAAAHRYYSRKRDRMPAWLTPQHIEQIDMFYLLARIETETTGVKHHVDHIVPLHGETVCGLHVPWNLQVLTARANVQKGNRFDG